MGLHEVRQHRLARLVERRPLRIVGQWRNAHGLASVEADEGGVDQFIAG
jgi:hypothetical protein